YIGQTDNFERRLEEHKTGQGAEWTKKRLPVEPIHWEIFSSREAAVNREQELKTGFGRKWLKSKYDQQGLARQAGGATKNIYLIDKQNIHNNRLQVINQYEAEGKRSNRYDVTILVNGLPMVHVELKRRGVDIREAFNQ